MTILEPTSAPAPEMTYARPTARGKFIFVGDEKLYVRGVTYGTFRPRQDGAAFPSPEVVEQDFAQMSRSGLNAVRTYTLPPRWLLDTAQGHGLRVMVGLPWEQHITFLDDPQRVRSIRERVRDAVRAYAGHPAILCYAIGNEVPAPIVRWHGRRRVERFLEGLYRIAKDEDPGTLVTYVNYPTTEYLQLPFVDIVTFNVYLEAREKLASYLARLQNIAGDRPLVMAEIGLDSRRNGLDAQARVLDWQVRTALAEGCAGAFVFAWTDDWYCGGRDIDDWDFGVTTRDRRPKPALAAVGSAFAQVPFPAGLPWPRVSVVVCSYNGAHTIRDCMEGLRGLQYPNFEVIVVDDGSTDRTAAIAHEYGVRVIRTENRGLSSARNTGMEAATGEIVAYLDDDAYPDPQWLTYLAHTFMSTTHAGVGGPNIAPAGDGPIADCVANAPGNPNHVLLSDQVAEHIPGCNMAFRKSCLEALGGFDPRFRVAGDDVDVCWCLQERGWTIGFSPSALVWHHRRNSVRAFWKQQFSYGKAESLLERKWPEKFNGTGHLTWGGRVYGKGLTRALGWRSSRICHGTWGAGLFQALYQSPPGRLSSLTLMPEWYLVIFVLAALSSLSALWRPLLATIPFLLLSAGIMVVQAGLSANHASFPTPARTRVGRLKRWGLTAFLHLLQPMARLWGRMLFGLTPWRLRGPSYFGLPFPGTRCLWSEQWQAPDAWLRSVEALLRTHGVSFHRGGDHDRWDLEVFGGARGAARALVTVEEHGDGNQLVRLKWWPRFSSVWTGLSIVCGIVSAQAAFGRAWAVSAVLAAMVMLIVVRMLQECASATGVFARVLEQAGMRGNDELA